MKRKQLLALVLVIVVMIGIMPIEKAESIEPGSGWSSCGCWPLYSSQPFSDYIFYPIDMFTHYSEERYVYKCRYCKAVIRIDVMDSGTESHTFRNGKCILCDYVKDACSHAGGNWNDVYDSSVLPVYRNENGQYHRVFNSYKRYCKDCNQYVKNVTDDGTLRAHSFTNGDTCICGYKKPVTGGETQHVGVSAKIDTDYMNYGSATTHQKRDVYGYTCSICSEIIIDRYSEWTSENHKDSGQGWCLLCGASVGASQSKDEPTVGPCTHPNYGYDLNGKGRTVKLDNEKHLYTFPVIYYCTVCGERWNGTESTEGKHSMTTKTEHEELNSTFHFVKKYSVCSAGCGMKEVVEVTTGNHTYDSTGKCTACGFTKEAPAAWQNVWNHIDKNMRIIELKLDSDALYLFEVFVETYRDSTYEQAWTAALSSVDVAKELPSATIKLIEGEANELAELFGSDVKIANLIIDYLYTSDITEKLESIKNNISAVNDVYKILDPELKILKVNSLLDVESISNLKIESVKTGKIFKLSELMNVTDDTYEAIYESMINVTRGDGTFTFEDPNLFKNTYLDTPRKIGDKVQEKLGKRIIEEHGDDTFEANVYDGNNKVSKVLKGAEVVSYLLTPVFSGIDAYSEFVKYEEVLNQYEKELTYIIESAGYENTSIVDKTLEILTNRVVNGIVLSVEKEIFADITATTAEMMIDISCIPVAVAKSVVDIESMILNLAANTSNTFSKVWGIEDLYEEFQQAEKYLLMSVYEFYDDPSDTTYNKLEASYAYYAMLVGSGANAVSNVFINDAESALYKFKNWVGGIFDGTDIDWRLEQIEYAKSIPDTDENTLQDVKGRIFP